MSKEIKALFHDGRTKSATFTPGSHLRQGDTLLTMMDAIPEGASIGKIPGGVIADGEVTGHAHRLVGNYSVFEKDGKTYFQVGPGDVTYAHEDHAHLVLPEGTCYCIGADTKTAAPAASAAGVTTSTVMGTGSLSVQREWSPEGNRAVRD